MSAPPGRPEHQTPHAVSSPHKAPELETANLIRIEQPIGFGSPGEHLKIGSFCTIYMNGVVRHKRTASVSM